LSRASSKSGLGQGLRMKIAEIFDGMDLMWFEGSS